jgi:hypothetical protein
VDIDERRSIGAVDFISHAPFLMLCKDQFRNPPTGPTERP